MTKFQSLVARAHAQQLRKQASALEKRASGVSDWIAKATTWLANPANQAILARWGVRGLVGGGIYAGTYAASGLLDPKKKYRGLRGLVSLIPAIAAATKGVDYVEGLRQRAVAQEESLKRESPAQSGTRPSAGEESDARSSAGKDSDARQTPALPPVQKLDDNDTGEPPDTNKVSPKTEEAMQDENEERTAAKKATEANRKSEQSNPGPDTESAMTDGAKVYNSPKEYERAQKAEAADANRKSEQSNPGPYTDNAQFANATYVNRHGYGDPNAKKKARKRVRRKLGLDNEQEPSGL